MNTLLTLITIDVPDNDPRQLWHATDRDPGDADDFAWAKRHTQDARQTFEAQGSGDGPIHSGGKTMYRKTDGTMATVAVALVSPARPDGCMEQHLTDLDAAFATDVPAS